MAPVALASCLAAAVLVGLAIVPVRTWLAQQRKMDEARTQLAQIDAEVADLERQLAQLQTDDEIERRARQDFDLVFPGEESYRILPEPGAQQP
ncbi:MAG: septum formation initiator family protein [Acidimicrobiia bacterium]|nr:septum formation initiator family protein [Acidimicrobiia bacterium]